LTLIGVGKALVIIGIVWLLTLFWVSFYYLGGWAIIGFIIFLGAGVACWWSGKSRLRNVKNRLSLVEDTVRRGKSLTMENKLGVDLETALDSIRTDISDLYLKVKYGETVDKLLDNIEETAKELVRCSETKDIERIRLQISTLRDRVADLRSEFRRR